MSETTHLPHVHRISVTAPLNWLALGWRDFQRAPGPCLIYGIGLAAISAAIMGVLATTGAFRWFLVLVGGFLLVAPILAMGAYQAARMLEAGQRPRISDMLFVRSAFRRDLAILGVALFVLFGLWVNAAHLTYGLSTRAVHHTTADFLTFMLTTSDGHSMALIGSVIGGAIAFLAYSLVVISAPMLLNEESDVFIATITSVRAVVENFLPMLVWAVLIAALTAIGIGTAFLGLIVIFPWIGLASWHAYRELTHGHA